MATVRKETLVNKPAAYVWDAIRDVGNVHQRVAPGFVRECRMEGDARLITFGNGAVARELIVEVDDQAQRFAYSARSERLTHHNASFQVFPEGADRCRVVWLADVLPHEAAQVVGAMMHESCAIMKRTLETGAKSG